MALLFQKIAGVCQRSPLFMACDVETRYWAKRVLLLQAPKGLLADEMMPDQ